MTQKSVSLKKNLLIIIMTSILLLQSLILAQANLITKTDLDGKLSSLNRKINLNKSKH